MTVPFDYKNIKMPNISTIIAVLAIVFAGGQWYSGHLRLLEDRKDTELIYEKHLAAIEKIEYDFEAELDSIEKSHSEDIKALNDLIITGQNIQNETLRKMGIISNELGHIRRAIEKLENTTQNQ